MTYFPPFRLIIHAEEVREKKRFQKKKKKHQDMGCYKMLWEKLSVTKNVWKGVLELSLARCVRTRQGHQVRKGSLRKGINKC